MKSILEKFTKIITDPYPHLVIEDALPEDLYNQLEREWPTQQLLATEPFDDGICYRLKSDEMLKADVVSDLWKEFARYHTSPQFYREVENVWKSGQLIYFL